MAISRRVKPPENRFAEVPRLGSLARDDRKEAGKGLGVRSAIKTCALLLAAVDVRVFALATFDTIRAE
jgi:hypothetical protein